MQNIPIFTGVHGMASLILKEIPTSGRAYVLVRSVWKDDLAGLLAEGRAFCRAAGAETVYGSWDCRTLPAEHAYDVWELTLAREDLPQPTQPLALTPLSGENGGDYLSVYNCCFQALPGHASYDQRDLQRLLGKSLAFLVYRQGVPAAVAEVGENRLEAIGVLPAFRGLGYPLALAVLQRLPGPTLTVRVASTNGPALALYRRIGFGAARTVSRWWRLSEIPFATEESCGILTDRN